MSEVALDQSALPDTDVDVNAPINAPANTVNTETEANVTGNNAVAIEREKSAIERFFEQPAVRRAAPAVVGLVVLVFCILFYINIHPKIRIFNDF